MTKLFGILKSGQERKLNATAQIRIACKAENGEVFEGFLGCCHADVVTLHDIPGTAICGWTVDHEWLIDQLGR